MSGTVEVLENGNFDATTPAWTQDPVNILCGPPQATPASGSVAACLGGTDGMTKTLSHTISLPEGASSARLTGSFCATSQEPTTAAEIDTLTFDILDGVAPISALGRRSNQNAVPNCELQPFMLEAQLSADPVNATLRIRSTLDTNRPTSFFLDSLVLTVACR